MGMGIGSYRAVEHLGGAGSRHRTSPFWRGEDARTAEDVSLTVLPVESGQLVRDLVERVGVVRRPHLLPVTDVVEDDTRLMLVCPWPRGGRLIELVRRRGVLAAGEAVTVLLPIAGALAELHRAGFRHGGVGPETIWFDSGGRPLLGAPAVSAAVAAVVGQGALGSADVAPEVLRQARTGPAGPAADTFSLGSVALFCLTGQSAWPADEPADVLVQSAGGQWPDPPAGTGPPELLDLLRSMLAPDPADRPTTESVVRSLTAVAARVEPAPIRFGSGPCPAPASSRPWRGWSGAADAETAVDADAELGTDIEPDTRTARRRRGPMARMAIALLLGMLLTVLVAQVGTWLGDPPAASEATAQDWLRVVADLDLARGRAFATGDVALLDQVYAPESAARAADTALIEQLASNGWRVVDGTHEIVGVQLLDEPGDEGSIRVAVVDRLPVRPVVDHAGHQVATTTGRGEQRRVLVLRATDAGYRIGTLGPSG